MVKYDLDNLSDAEITELLHSLKHPTAIKSFKSWYEDISSSFFVGKVSYDDQRVIGDIDKIVYILHVHTSSFENRFSIHLRFKENNMHILRLDIGSGHTNPDGTHIDSDHIHVYVVSTELGC